MGKGRVSAKTEGVRSLARRGVAPSAHGDGTAGRAPRFSRYSSVARVGRTIGAERERLETANERAAARQKDKRKDTIRITTVSLIFLVLIAGLIIFAVNFFGSRRDESTTVTTTTTTEPLTPTIEIIDENSSGTDNKITSRMNEYIALAESDLKDLGLKPVKAVLPAGSIREVDFYLEGHNGRIKMIIDRDPAISAEDTERMLRYLTEQGVTDFEYIDVRTDGKAYWK